MTSMFFAYVAYDYETGIDKSFKNYFGNKFCMQTDICNDTQWRIVGNSTTFGSAGFVHAYHPESKTDVIGIRGTQVNEDWTMNAVLLGGSISITLINMIFPVDTFIP